MLGVNALATDDPLPVKATFTTVLPIVKSVVETLLLKVAVPPTSAKVKVVTPLIAPDAVMSALATVPVDSVNALLPPVTAAIVMSPSVLVALVSIVVALAKVTAPKVSTSLELAMVPVSYTHLTLPTNREV